MSVLSDGDGNTCLCRAGQRGDRHLLSLPIDLFGQRRIDQAGRNPRQTVEEVAKTFVLDLDRETVSSSTSTSTGETPEFEYDQKTLQSGVIQLISAQPLFPAQFHATPPCKWVQ